MKTRPLIIVSLTISATTMAFHAYNQFNARDIVYGVVFTGLAVFFIGLVVASVIINKTLKIENNKKKSQNH